MSLVFVLHTTVKSAQGHIIVSSGQLTCYVQYIDKWCI
jgi:hypothetical protein